MGIDLLGVGQQDSLGFKTWTGVQLLALTHGWEPEGTYGSYADHDGSWRGYDYNSNNGQWVTAEDASNMAAALRSALDSLVETPDQAQEANVEAFMWPERVAGQSAGRPPEEMIRSALAWFSGSAGRQRLEGLIRFCESSGFRIS